MKKTFILILFIVVTFKSVAQVTSLSENFNTYCVVDGETYPPNWSAYNNSPDPEITWTCGPTQGRPAIPGATPSPGILCTNLDATNTYLDTAWLFTPQLNLSFYTGNIYLQFDSKYVLADGRFSLLVSNDYEAGLNPDSVLDTTHTWYDATSSLTPVLGNVGTSDWVTYVVDLTVFKAAPLYVAFRYTAAAGGQSTWVIDNVYTTQTPPSSVPVINKQSLFLNVIGYSTPDQVSLSYNVPYAGTYQLAIYDMMGHKVYKESINAVPGQTNHTISSPSLTDGMYLVKMENGTVYNTAKIMIK